MVDSLRSSTARTTGPSRGPITPPAARQLPRLIGLGRLGLLLAGSAWVVFLFGLIFGTFGDTHWGNTRWALEAAGYAIIVTLMLMSTSAYLVARGGYLHRVGRRALTPRAELEAYFLEHQPTATVLIPSYREEPRVILQTMMSAALQEFPSKRVVLLIDDPVNPTEQHHIELLEGARRVPLEIQRILANPRRRFEESTDRTEALIAKGRPEPSPDDLVRLSEDFAHAGSWHEQLAERWQCYDHTDEFFVEHVLREQSVALQKVANALVEAVASHQTMSWRRYRQLLQRLVSIFSVELSSFERKSFPVLNHEPNKAMNLNSYLGLMGSSYVTHETADGTLLYRCGTNDAAATMHAPRTDYVVTLDADSVLLPEYCLRIVHLMEQPEHAKVGVAQTPYSSYPDAPTRVERMAGATTDLQYMLHVGMCHYDAAFWVGANAVLRMDAIEELRRVEGHGQLVARFLADRTPIEDTESTLDLTMRGWSIYNYPARLAYSCSPPDFGALTIQRQRWSNGGLVILPKLAAHLRARRQRDEKVRSAEVLLRANYLASIAWTTAGLLVLLAYPFTNTVLLALVIVMSMPYFLVMSSDLHHLGYRRLDVLRIFGFNLIMLPVNASGVLQSLQQLVTGSKSVFRRTPKISSRTVAPASFVILAWIIVVGSALMMILNFHDHRNLSATFAAINLVLAAASVVSLIGIRHSITDVWVAIRGFISVPVATASTTTEEPSDTWAGILFDGRDEKPRPAQAHIFEDPEGLLGESVSA